MSWTLVGATYIGSGTLPTPVAGYEARDTNTGNIYVSNTNGTAWTLIGNANTTNLGLLPLTGGTMTGAINGVTGWAPVDSPNFTTTAKLAGVTLATLNDLSNTSNTILNSIQPKITEAVAQTTSSISVLNNVARAKGVLKFLPSGAQPSPQTIPLPTFPDGSTALEGNCVWSVGLIGWTSAGQANTTFWPCGRSDSNGNVSLVFSADPSTTRTFAAWIQDSGSPANYYNAIISYQITGYR